MIKSICIYCGSSDSIHPDYLEAAAIMGQTVAKAGLRLIYGAGKTGLMGAVADGALTQGGEVVGIVPENLNTDQLIHQNLTCLEVVNDIQIRKARMSALADAFIALPGGFGTLDELFETLTWAQIGLHRKPIGLLNTRGYYDPLITLVNHALREGFIYAEHSYMLVMDGNPQNLLEKIFSHQYPEKMDRWVNRNEKEIP